jgi:C4-dicarboxylate-specific signal transduction histidine kinase
MLAAHLMQLELEYILHELKIAKEDTVKEERLHAFGQLSRSIAHNFNNLLTLFLPYSIY